MATVIDSLLISVGLDFKPVAAGRKQVETELDKTKDAFKRRGDDIERISKGIEGGIEKVARKAAALFLMFAGAGSIMGFARNVYSATLSTGQFTEVLGLNIKQVSAWEQAVQRMQGTAEEARASIGAIVQAQTEFKTPGGQADHGFAQAIGTLLAGQNVDPFHTDPFELLRKLAAAHSDPRFQGPGGEALYHQLLLQAHQSEGMIRTLRQGGPALDKTLADTSSTAKTESNYEKAKQLAADFTKIVNDLQSIALTILDPLMPQIAKFLEAVDKFLKANMGWIKEKIGEGIAAVINALKNIDLPKLAGEIDALVTSLGGWEKIGIALFAAWATVKVVGFVTSLGTIATAVGMLGEASLALAPALVPLLALLALEPEIAKFDGTLADRAKAKKDRDDSGELSAGELFHYFMGRMRRDRPTGALADREQDAMDYLVKTKGMTPEDAAALVGNFQQESGVDPAMHNASGSGVASWVDPGRVAWMTKRLGMDIHQAPLHAQLDAALEEYREKYPEAYAAMLRAKTVAEKSKIVTKQYEAPKDADGMEVPNRAVISDHVLKMWRDKHPEAGSPPTPPAPTTLRPRTRPPSVYDPSAPPSLAPYGPTGPPLPVPAAPASTPNVPLGRPAPGNTTAVNIGTVTIQTAATDAKGIVRDFRAAMSSQFAQRDIVLGANFGRA